MARISDDELREFLTRWLMEFGMEEVPASAIEECRWYMDDRKLMLADHPQYFDWNSTAPTCTKLKPEALNFIKGEPHG